MSVSRLEAEVWTRPRYVATVGGFLTKVAASSRLETAAGLTSVRKGGTGLGLSPACRTSPHTISF